MGTVAERIAWILETQQISARELARKAGFHGSEVSTLLKRLEADPEAVTLRTLRALADGAGVSLAWLAVGEGEGYAGHRVATDPSPSRTEAAQVALHGGVWGEAVRSVLAEELRAGDAELPAEWWLLRMRQREIEMIQEALRRHRAPPPREPSRAPATMPLHGEPFRTSGDADEHPLASARGGVEALHDTPDSRRHELDPLRIAPDQEIGNSESGVVLRQDVEEVRKRRAARMPSK